MTITLPQGAADKLRAKLEKQERKGMPRPDPIDILVLNLGKGEEEQLQ